MDYKCDICRQPCVAKGSENWRELCPLIAKEKEQKLKYIEEKKKLLRKVKSIPFPSHLTLSEVMNIIQKQIEDVS